MINRKKFESRCCIAICPVDVGCKLTSFPKRSNQLGIHTRFKIVFNYLSTNNLNMAAVQTETLIGL